MVPPVNAELAAKFSLKSFKPYLAREYNTVEGWLGQPVNLKDPRVFKYWPKSNNVMASMEFNYELKTKNIISEVFNFRKDYNELNYKDHKVLNHFLLHSTKGDITPEHIKIAFSSISPCNSHTFKVKTARDLRNLETKDNLTKKGISVKYFYYLTVFNSRKDREFFVRISLRAKNASEIHELGPEPGECCPKPKICT